MTAALSGAALLLLAPTSAIADSAAHGRTKAQIEYAERTSNPPSLATRGEPAAATSKAQIEHEEMVGRAEQSRPVGDSDVAPTQGSSPDAAAWQLALSAALGAAAAGVVVLAVSRARQPQPVA